MIERLETLNSGDLPESAELRSLTEETCTLFEDVAWHLDDNQVERISDLFIEDDTYQVVSRENFSEGLPHAAIYCDCIAMVHNRMIAMRQMQVYVPRSWRHFISGVRLMGGSRRSVTCQRQLPSHRSHVGLGPDFVSGQSVSKYSGAPQRPTQIQATPGSLRPPPCWALDERAGLKMRDETRGDDTVHSQQSETDARGHANLYGPAGFHVAMEDSKVLAESEGGTHHAEAFSAVLETGASVVHPQAHVVTEVFIQAFYKRYCEAMGL